MLEPRLTEALARLAHVAATDSGDHFYCASCYGILDEGDLDALEVMKGQPAWRTVRGHTDDCPIKILSDFSLGLEQLAAEEEATPTPKPEPERPAGWLAGPADELLYYMVGAIRRRKELYPLPWVQLVDDLAAAVGSEKWGVMEITRAERLAAIYEDGKEGRPYKHTP